MKRIVTYLSAILLMAIPAKGVAQSVALKTNLLSDIALTPSLAVEVAMSRHFSLNLNGSYMPFRLNRNHYWRTFLVQPEARYWFKESLTGFFLGAAYQYRGFNLGGLPFSHLKDSRSQGHMQGCGLNLGYSFRLSRHWNLEPSLMLGWSHLHWTHYDKPDSDIAESWWKADYVGPLDVGLYLEYTF